MLAAVGGQYYWMRWQRFMLGAEGAKVCNAVLVGLMAVSIEYKGVERLERQSD